MKRKIKHLLLALLFVGSIVDVSAQQLAFPGAQGWGRFATGGRTGTVYHVTNLNDSGTGSLRDAVSQPNRIIVFDVAGVIKLNSRMVFSKNLYVAGQTAPGEGVTVYGDAVSFSGADNIIVRHMRFRMGAGGSSGKDCAGVANGRTMIFDHCSFAWGRDETFSISWDNKGTAPRDITLSNCIIGQGLLTHSAGGLMQAENITLYRNFYCDNNTRNNKVKGISQYVNNIVYNWKDGCYIMGGDSEGQAYANIESNLFINGPGGGGDAFTGGNGNFHFYGNDNWQDNNRDGALAPFAVTKYSASDRQSTPYDYPALEKWSGKELVEKLLPTVGASLPYRDYTDCYMVDEALTFGKKGEFIANEGSLLYGIPTTWTVWKGNTRVDSDKDGMPDAWETANGTNPNKDDAMTIAANGYANIENYINSIDTDSRDYFLRAPMCVDVDKATTTTLKLVWADYTDNEEGFAIEVEKGGAYAEVGRVKAGETTYTITGLDPETTYNVRLRSYAGDKTSDYTPVLKAMTRPVEVGIVDIDTYVPELTWAGNATAWDFTTAAWNDGTAAFADGKDILFAPTTNTEVTLNTTVAPKTVVVNSDANLTVSGTGAITGSTTVNKAGEGTFVLNTTNTYTGATVLHGGVLEFGSLKNGGVASSLGSGVSFAQNWIFDGGTYKYTGGTTTTDRAGRLLSETELNIANSGTTVNMSGAFEGTGNFVLGGSGQLTVTDTQFFGYTGATVLKGGTLYLSTFDITKAGIGSSSKLVMAGGHLRTAGDNNADETYSFPIEVKENTVSQFTPNQRCYIASPITGTGTLQVNIPYVREYFKNASLSGFKGRLIANGGNNGGLFLLDSGFKTAADAVVELTNGARLCHWATDGAATFGGIAGTEGTYISGSSKQTDGFNCTWTVGSANTNETFAGEINNWSAGGNGHNGTVNIIKVGTGDWRLTGNNDYKGTTQVDGGALIINGRNLGTGAVSVSEGATFKGTGTVSGKVTANAGATVCAGDTLLDGSALKLNGGLSLKEGAIVKVPVAVNGTKTKSNKIQVKGSLAVSGATLVVDMSDVSEKLYGGMAFRVFDLSGATVMGSGFTTIEPAAPSENQTWDTSELMTEGIIKVVGGDPLPDDGTGGEGGGLDEVKVVLTHTVGTCYDAAAGSNNNTLDSSNEYFNCDTRTGWVGYAFADFAVHIPADEVVTSAVLTWTATSAKSYDNTIYYLNPGTQIDYTSILDKTVRHSFEDARTFISTTAGANTTKTYVTDVTEALKTIVAAGQENIIFQWTGNNGSATLAGKGSGNAPTLEITTTSLSDYTSYTINYTFGESVVSTESGTELIGSTITAATVVYDDRDNRYLTVAAAAPTLTLAKAAEANTLNVPVREPYTATLELTKNFAGATTTENITFTEQDDKTIPWSYTYSMYEKHDGSYYLCDNSTFLQSGKFSADKEVVKKTVNYSKRDDAVAFFGEWESDEVAASSITINYVDKNSFSGGQGKNMMKTDGTLTMPFTLAEAGEYRITMPYINENNKSRDHAISVDGSAEDITSVASGGSGTYNKTFTLAAGDHNIVIRCVYSLTSTFDYALIKRIGGTGITDVNADMNGASTYYTLQGIKVSEPRKGIYIVNGKKVVIK